MALDNAEPLSRSSDLESWAPKRIEKVSESLARRILAEITEFKLAPGTQLPSETEMLQRFGVGRGSLREALRILEVYGVVAVRSGPGGGPVVQTVDSRDFARAASFYFHLAGARFREVIEARHEMEPMMARLAARVVTPETARQLEENVSASQGVSGDRSSVRVRSRYSRDFHTLVAGSSGNRVLDTFSRSTRDIYFDWIDDRSMASAGEHKKMCAEHAAIASAIISKDEVAAELAMRDHMKTVTMRALKKLDFMMDDVVRWE